MLATHTEKAASVAMKPKANIRIFFYICELSETLLKKHEIQ